MSNAPEPFPSSSAGFEPTRWSVVVAAKGEQTNLAREALEDLCGAYWPPLYGFIRRSGYSSADAQDLTQGFFERFIAKDYLSDVAQDKGRFRSFLLASLKHFLANQRDREKAEKRGGSIRIVPFEFENAESSYCIQPSHNLTPETIFEKQWATTLLSRVLNRLKDQYQRSGKGKLFETLKASLAGSKESLPYSTLAEQLEMSEAAIKVAVHRLRQHYRELLRDEISRTVASPAEIEAELRYLFGVLSA